MCALPVFESQQACKASVPFLRNPLDLRYRFSSSCNPWPLLHHPIGVLPISFTILCSQFTIINCFLGIKIYQIASSAEAEDSSQWFSPLVGLSSVQRCIPVSVVIQFVIHESIKGAKWQLQ